MVRRKNHIICIFTSPLSTDTETEPVSKTWRKVTKLVQILSFNRPPGQETADRKSVKVTVVTPVQDKNMSPSVDEPDGDLTWQQVSAVRQDTS